MKNKLPYYTPEQILKQKTQVKEKKSAPKSELSSVFDPAANWFELKSMNEKVTEPLNASFSKTRAPDYNKDVEFVQTKYNFGETFERPAFEGTVEKVIINKRTRKPKRNNDGSIQTKTEHRSKGCVDPAATKKYNLSTTTTPAEYLEMFLPTESNPYTTNKEEWLSIKQLTKFTNAKALLAGAGDTMYPDWKPFTTKEIKQHLGLYMLHGLSPSPRVEYKFQPQRVDPVHGNDFVHSSFGPNAARRHKHFKAFFACQDARIQVPERKKYPNWKMRPFLKWMNKIFPLIWLLGIALAIDEMTMRFKGQHQDKKRITYKKEVRLVLCFCFCNLKLIL